MPEAFSTPNLVALPITSQELGRGAFLPPPNQNSTIKQPTTIGLKINKTAKTWEKNINDIENLTSQFSFYEQLIFYRYLLF